MLFSVSTIPMMVMSLALFTLIQAHPHITRHHDEHGHESYKLRVPFSELNQLEEDLGKSSDTTEFGLEIESPNPYIFAYVQIPNGGWQLINPEHHGATSRIGTVTIATSTGMTGPGNSIPKFSLTLDDCLAGQASQFTAWMAPVYLQDPHFMFHNHRMLYAVEHNLGQNTWGTINPFLFDAKTCVLEVQTGPMPKTSASVDTILFHLHRFYRTLLNAGKHGEYLYPKLRDGYGTMTAQAFFGRTVQRYDVGVSLQTVIDAYNHGLVDTDWKLNRPDVTFFKQNGHWDGGDLAIGDWAFFFKTGSKFRTSTQMNFGINLDRFGTDTEIETQLVFGSGPISLHKDPLVTNWPSVSTYGHLGRNVYVHWRENIGSWMQTCGVGAYRDDYNMRGLFILLGLQGAVEGSLVLNGDTSMSPSKKSAMGLLVKTGLEDVVRAACEQQDGGCAGLHTWAMNTLVGGCVTSLCGTNKPYTANCIAWLNTNKGRIFNLHASRFIAGPPESEGQETAKNMYGFKYHPSAGAPRVTVTDHPAKVFMANGRPSLVMEARGGALSDCFQFAKTTHDWSADRPVGDYLRSVADVKPRAKSVVRTLKIIGSRKAQRDAIARKAKPFLDRFEKKQRALRELKKRVRKEAWI